jgi:hypothetical protein
VRVTLLLREKELEKKGGSLKKKGVNIIIIIKSLDIYSSNPLKSFINVAQQL